MSYSYTTPALVQSELRSSTAFDVTTTPSITDVQEWIQEESAYVNHLAETIWGSTYQVETIDYSGEDDLFLENAPVLSVNNVEYNQYYLGDTVGPSYVSKTVDVDYTVYLDRGIIRLLRNNFNPVPGVKKFKISYVSGYEPIPLEIRKLTTKMVAERCLSAIIQQNINERNDGGTVSVGSISIVEPAAYGVASFKKLKEDIQDLKNSVVDFKFKAFRYAHI